MGDSSAPSEVNWSCWVASVVSDSLQACGLQPTRLLCPRDSPGKKTGVGCHALLQGVFPTEVTPYSAGKWPGLEDPGLNLLGSRWGGRAHRPLNCLHVASPAWRSQGFQNVPRTELETIVGPETSKSVPVYSMARSGQCQRDSASAPVAKTPCSQHRGPDSIPAQGAELHVPQPWPNTAKQILIKKKKVVTVFS